MPGPESARETNGLDNLSEFNGLKTTDAKQNYYSVSPGMLSKIPGKGAAYMMAFTDGAGTPLSRGSNYRLHLPANIPAALFWSVTLYEAENASGLANGQPFPSLGSRDKPAKNADGSTDLSLGPKATCGQRRQLPRGGSASYGFHRRRRPSRFR